MAWKELNLFQFAAGAAAEATGRPPKIVRCVNQKP